MEEIRVKGTQEETNNRREHQTLGEDLVNIYINAPKKEYVLTTTTTWTQGVFGRDHMKMIMYPY